MFPLGTVLLPGQLLPLHVFEPRYRALTGWCLERDGRLGIVLIERGSEVGGGDVRCGVGTEGRIVDSAALPDGRWLLAVQGERRIRVRRWIAEEPFPQAEVDPLEDLAGRAPTAAARDRIAEQVRQAVALRVRLQEWPPGEPVPELARDPARAGWQAAGSGLLSLIDAQRLLEIDGLDERLARLSVLLDEALHVLALRAAER